MYQNNMRALILGLALSIGATQTGCGTVLGTGIGMAGFPPIRSSFNGTLTGAPGEIIAEQLEQKLKVTRGDRIWVTHGEHSRITQGTFAALAARANHCPEGESAADSRARGVKRTVLCVEVDGRSDFVSLVEVTEVRVERPREVAAPLWLLGTAVGVAADAVLYFIGSSLSKIIS